MLASEWPRYHYRVEEGLYVHDGDTSRVILDLGDSVYVKRYLRLIGVYAPELDEPGGADALDEYDRLVGSRPRFVLTKKDQYSFNRILAWESVEPAPGAHLVSVNDHMIRWLTGRQIARDPAREARLVLPLSER